MTAWVRLWEDMPTDPKWRVIARKSGQPLACVIAMFTLMLTEAGRAPEKGDLAGWNNEDAAAALDMEESAVEAIWDAMQGRVIEATHLSGWDKRQPKREDSSAERVAKHRETKRNEVKRGVTQGNAPDKKREEEKEEPPKPPTGGRAAKHLLPDDWVLPVVSELTPQAKACAEQWTAASYAAQGEEFENFWRGRGRMMKDWRLTWCGRVVDKHAAVMRDQKFGNGAPAARKPGGGGKSPANGTLFARLQAGEIDTAEFNRLRDEALREQSPDPPRKASSAGKPIGQFLPRIEQLA